LSNLILNAESSSIHANKFLENSRSFSKLELFIKAQDLKVLGLQIDRKKAAFSGKTCKDSI